MFPSRDGWVLADEVIKNLAEIILTDESDLCDRTFKLRNSEHKDCSSIEIYFQREKVEAWRRMWNTAWRWTIMHWWRRASGSLSVFELPPTFFDGLLTNGPLIIEVTFSEDMRGGGEGRQRTWCRAGQDRQSKLISILFIIVLSLMRWDCAELNVAK